MPGSRVLIFASCCALLGKERVVVMDNLRVREIWLVRVTGLWTPCQYTLWVCRKARGVLQVLSLCCGVLKQEWLETGKFERTGTYKTELRKQSAVVLNEVRAVPTVVIQNRT